MVCVARASSCIGSPSSRRAWVEMYLGFIVARFGLVALLTEGVGRNHDLWSLLSAL